MTSLLLSLFLIVGFVVAILHVDRSKSSFSVTAFATLRVTKKNTANHAVARRKLHVYNDIHKKEAGVGKEELLDSASGSQSPGGILFRPLNTTNGSLLDRRAVMMATAATSSAVLQYAIVSSGLPNTNEANAAMPVILGGTRLFSSSAATTSSPYVVIPAKKGAIDTPQKEPINDKMEMSTRELCLLKLLPVKNQLFRQLVSTLEDITTSILRPSSNNQPHATTDELVWQSASIQLQRAISDLDRQRYQIRPVFNPDENSSIQIAKGERGERLIEKVRYHLVHLRDAVIVQDSMALQSSESQALLDLSELGELLVATFPYEVPTEGRFSYIPRLLGRAKVSFAFQRGMQSLGNVTIIADGYAAPVTAGNFVDLSIRQFYTGLPIKYTKKRVGSGSSGSEFEVANIPILGSFNEGFYDPLTAKPRHVPLEILRLSKLSGTSSLSYAPGFANSVTAAATEFNVMERSQPLLSFNIPGLVAMNHPDKNPNGGSSEFFSLQRDSVMEDKRRLLDGEYAPFGYIIDGYELFQSLRANDVISDTVVDEWGQLNLVKLRQSSFSEIAGS